MGKARPATQPRHGRAGGHDSQLPLSVVIYTAVFGGYDDLQPHPEIPGIDFVAFTDSPSLTSDEWIVRTVPPDGRHPRVQAKELKLFPERYFPDHEFTVWIDCSHEILTEHFANRALAAIDESGIALYTHPWRDCIYEEAAASIVLPKYAGQRCTAQVESYRSEGHPERWGLYATGTIARRSGATGTLMADWWGEIERWTYQDQLSFPVACRRAGIRPATFPCHQVYGNTWTAIRPHHRED